MSKQHTNPSSVNPNIPSSVRTVIKKKRSFWHWVKFAFKVFLYAHLTFIAITALLLIIYINTNPPYTVLMLYRQGISAKMPSYLPLQETSQTFQLDLINLEDGHFRKHYGIDIEAIQRARKQNAKAGRTAQGGSTITQQLARTLFLTPHRTYLRKYLELIVTLELELILRKDRILELYINYAELGDGVFGFNDAALHYYKKTFAKTSTDQKIRLMTILASPINYSPTTLHNNRALAARYKFIYKYHKYH